MELKQNKRSNANQTRFALHGIGFGFWHSHLLFFNVCMKCSYVYIVYALRTAYEARAHKKNGALLLLGNLCFLCPKTFPHMAKGLWQLCLGAAAHSRAVCVLHLFYMALLVLDALTEKYKKKRKKKRHTSKLCNARR